MAAWVEATTREVGQSLINPDKPSVSASAIPEDMPKPALGQKPHLMPKPFTLQRNATVRPIRAPKTNFSRQLNRAASSETLLNTSEETHPGGPKTSVSNGTVNGSNQSAAPKPVSLSPTPDLNAKPKPDPTKSPVPTGPSVTNEDVQPRSRAKSLGSQDQKFPNQKAQEEADETEAEVKVARCWPARNRLSAELTSKFEVPSQPENTVRKDGETNKEEKERPPQSPSAVSESKSPVETGDEEFIGGSIKRRISLLFDRSAASQRRETFNKRDVTAAEISADIKQRIQNLSLDAPRTRLPSTGAPISPPSEKKQSTSDKPENEILSEKPAESTTEKASADKPSSIIEVKNSAANVKKVQEEEDNEKDKENYVAMPVYRRVGVGTNAEMKRREEEEKKRKEEMLEKERQQRERERLLEEERKAMEIERQRNEERKQEEERQRQMEERRKQDEERKRKLEEERREEERRRQMEEEKRKIEEEKERQREEERLRQEKLEKERKMEEEKRRIQEMERQKEEERLREEEMERIRKEREIEEEKRRIQELERQKEQERLRKEQEMERIRKEREMEEERLRQEREKERLKKEKEKEMEEERRRIQEMERQKEEERLKKEQEMERIRKEREMEERKIEEERLRQEREKERLKKEKEKEMEEERRRIQELERQKEEERLRKEQEMERTRKEKEMEEERKRIQELERQKEEGRLRKEQEMERLRKEKEVEEERKRIQELERQKEEERLRKEQEMERIMKERETEERKRIEEERRREEERSRQERETEQLKKEKQMEEERQRLQEMERQKEEERKRRKRETEMETCEAAERLRVEVPTSYDLISFDAEEPAASQTLVSPVQAIDEVLYDDFSVRPQRWGIRARRSSTPSPSRESPDHNLQPEPTSSTGSQEPCGGQVYVDDLIGFGPQTSEISSYKDTESRKESEEETEIPKQEDLLEPETDTNEGELEDCEPEEDGVAEPDEENLIEETSEQSENNDTVDDATESRLNQALQRLTQVRRRKASSDSDAPDVPVHHKPEPLPVLQSSAPPLDSSVLRSKVDLGKKRSIKRTRPSRAVRQRAALPALTEGTNPDWRFCDSTDAKDPCSNGGDSESEEEPSQDTTSSPAPSHPKRVPLFPGMDPSALMAQLKRRSGVVEVDSPAEAQVPPSVPARSPRTPTMSLGPRVLPPADTKDSGSGSSPAWLLELKSKKRMSQPDSDA